MLTQDGALTRALETLVPVADEVVVVGGIGLRLLSSHPDAHPLGRETLATTDLDVAVRDRAPEADALPSRLEERGFQWRPRGELEPPAADYVIETDTGPFKVEFLAQRRGAPSRRDGSANATALRLGVSVALMPRLWPALHAPWRVPAPGVSGGRSLHVVNPGAFVVQKLLTMNDRRTPAKQEKDLLQVIEAMRLFGDVLPELRDHVGELRRRMTNAERIILADRMHVLRDPCSLHFAAAAQARQAGAVDMGDPAGLAAMFRQGSHALGLS